MIVQEQLPMVALPSMNDTHLEEIIIINKLSNATENNDIDAVATILNELLEHTIVHFSGEEEMMLAAHFGPYTMHKGEHDKHIHELKSLIKSFGENQDLKAISTYIDDNLVKWLIHHVQTMDTVTAKFLSEAN